MAASKAQRALTAERRSKAIALRIAGADFEKIARQLGYSSRSSAFIDISRALEANVAEMNRNAEVLRQEELSRLDRLQVGLWAQATSGDCRAVETIIKIIDRRCKLLGLDAPTRHEVMTVDAIDFEIRRLTAEIAGGAEAGEAAGVAAAPRGEDR